VNPPGVPKGPETAPLAPIPMEAEAEKTLAWELVDAGRYMPRRIRGSFRGRELG